MHGRPCRNANRGNKDPRRDLCDIEEIERLQKRVWDLELQHSAKSDEVTKTEPFIWDDGVGPKNPFHNPFGREDRRNPFTREPGGDSLCNFGVKIDVLEFDWKVEPDLFIEWLQTVERIFDLRDIPDDDKVKFVAIKLRKYASLWWEHVKKKQAQEGKSKISTWNKMKKLLREKFLPPNFLQEAFLEYHNLSQ